MWFITCGLLKEDSLEIVALTGNEIFSVFVSVSLCPTGIHHQS